MEKSTNYQDRYGAWAGCPKGSPPDLTRCCKEVHESWRGGLFHQCQKKRGHGPDGAYCKQHDPAAVKARQDASMKRWKEQSNKDRYKWYGKTFFDALLKIAEGHNDARGLAQEVIDAFNEGAQ